MDPDYKPEKKTCQQRNIFRSNSKKRKIVHTSRPMHNQSSTDANDIHVHVSPSDDIESIVYDLVNDMVNFKTNIPAS